MSLLDLQRDVKRLRTTLKLTQTEFASLLGVHVITVSKWERSKADINPYNHQQIVALREGVKQMSREQREHFDDLIGLGVYVGALAVGIVAGLPQARRGSSTLRDAVAMAIASKEGRVWRPADEDTERELAERPDGSDPGDDPAERKKFAKQQRAKKKERRP